MKVEGGTRPERQESGGARVVEGDRNADTVGTPPQNATVIAQQAFGLGTRADREIRAPAVPVIRMRHVHLEERRLFHDASRSSAGSPISVLSARASSSWTTSIFTR